MLCADAYHPCDARACVRIFFFVFANMSKPATKKKNRCIAVQCKSILGTETK